MIAPISVLLVFLNGKRIFRTLTHSYFWSGLLVLAGTAAYLVAKESELLSSGGRLSVTMLSFVMLVIAGFLVSFGSTAARRAVFPLGFLFLMVPLPPEILGRIIYFLQVGSTATAYSLFHLFAVPVFRDQFVLQLPQFSIQVAAECSSIRSSLALFITGLLIAYLYLRKPWTRAVLVALTVPLSVLKNGVRIVTLCMLAMDVNPGFLTGRLHHEGGIVFFLFALLILGGVLRVLRWAENIPSAVGTGRHDTLESNTPQNSANLSEI